MNFNDKKKQHNTYSESACRPQTRGPADCWYCLVLISNSLWNVTQKPEPGKRWKSSSSVSCQCSKGWTYWLRPALLSHLFQAIWKAFKSQLSCNGVLTNNTKALVYVQTREASLVQVQDSGTMGAILGKNTFELSSSITDDDRTSEWTLISEGMIAGGRPLCHPSPLSHRSWAICPVWLVMLRMQRLATKCFEPLRRRERKCTINWGPQKMAVCSVFL